MRGLFPPDQSPTGYTAFVFAVIALILFMVMEMFGSYWALCASVLCAGCTLLAFFLAAWAYRERHGRLESARVALVVATGLMVYYSLTRIF